MTNTELIQAIRAEIERRITDNTFGAKLELIDILAWLSTLESEKPMEGLEEDMTNEADKMFFSLGFYEGDKHEPMLDCVSLDEFRGIARHFAEWGYLRAAEKYDEIEYNRQRAEEEIPNDLEEAAEKEYPCDKSCMTPDMLDLNAHKQVAFRKGAKWQKEQDQETIKLSEINPFLAGINYQKEQMMKEAVEGEVTTDNRGNNVVRAGVFNEDFENGDKVRIIIVKED